MSYSISTLLTRNLDDVFGETIPRVGARLSTRSTLKIACSTTHPDFRYQLIAPPEELGNGGFYLFFDQLP